MDARLKEIGLNRTIDELEEKLADEFGRALQAGAAMMTLAKPCVLAGRCPGDRGETDVLWFGRLARASKASAVVKLYGALESAEAFLNLAAVKASGRRARALRLSFWSLQYAGFYLATGDDRRLSAALSLLHKAARLAYVLSRPAPLGWVICADEECALINAARVQIRWAERRLVQIEEGAEAAALLNKLANVLFELMRSSRHLVSANGRLIEVGGKRRN